VVVRSWLRQARRVRDQAGLTTPDRQRNLSGALSVRRRAAPRGGDVVVITDDVVTTGATLTEAVRVLGAAGFPVIGAATVAATTRLAPARALPGQAGAVRALSDD
jgi:predicted amidophosphoribosyltransferase